MIAVMLLIAGAAMWMWANWKTKQEMNDLNSKRALAENLRKNIYDLNMTQAKYAKEIGIPINTLEYAISGKGSVSLNTLDKIAYGAGIDPWELIRPSESK